MLSGLSSDAKAAAMEHPSIYKGMKFASIGFMQKIILFVATLCIVTACVSTEGDFEYAYGSISDKYMREFVKTISDDSFMGRMPFSSTEKKTIEYLSEQLKKAGFSPAFGDSSWFEEVPMVGIRSQVENLYIKKSDLLHRIFPARSSIELDKNTEIAIHSPLPEEKIKIEDVPVVFCGFGIDAPEYGWNDFEGKDVSGKIIIVIINDPGLYSEQSGELSPSFFKGKDLTYYGRWTYKFEEAAAKGAVGVLIVHDDYGAGYGYGVASRSAYMENLYLDTPELANRCKIEGWISASCANKIFSAAGYDFFKLKQSACRRGFKPVDLRVTLSAEMHNIVKKNKSYNVAGIIKGKSEPEKGVVISAHWDHFGVEKDAVKKQNKENAEQSDYEKDTIYNGAIDNAVAMGWALEIGRAFKKLKHKPSKSLVILFSTAEEQGLYGAKYYVSHPVITMENTLACLNNDMMVPRGKMKDLVFIGKGTSPLLDSLYDIAAARQDRYVTPDPDARSGLFYRSDQFPFYRQGVPVSWARGCFDSRNHGKGWAKDSWDDFINNVYHTVNDNYVPDWDWSGIVEDTQIGFHVAYSLLK